MKRIIYLFAFLAIISSCEEVDDYLPTNFNYPIPQVDITENVRVGVYYHQYAQADWIKKYTFTPTLGEYDALDAAVMDQHKTWAGTAGIDYFIFPWNGTKDNPLLNSFAASTSGNVKMVIGFNTAHLGATNASPLTGAKLTNMLNELKTLASTHFDNNYYFKVDNRPVIMISPINLSSGAAASIDYTTVVPAVRQEFSTVGINPFIIGEITLGWQPPQRYSAANKKFDAVVLRDWKTDGNYGYDRSVFYPAYTDQAFKNWSDSTATWGIDFIPTILPGFDDKTMTPASKIYNLNRSSKFYTDMCNVAKRNMGSHRIIMINSWNNFQQGTTLEPASEYNTEYLQITKNMFKIN